MNFHLPPKFTYVPFHEYSLSVRSLGRMKQDNALYITLYKSIVADFHHMTLDQMSDMVWSMVRVKHSDKAVIMAVYKKLNEVVSNQQKTILYKQNQALPTESSLASINDQQTQKIHHMYEGSFVRLIWALEKTTIIDSKLFVNLLKLTFQDKESSNMEKIRIQNLSLLAYCIFQIKIQKYRIAQSIINQIMKSWEELPTLSILSLSLLSQTFSRFIDYKTDFNNKYQKDWTPEQIEKKNQFLQKEKKFLYLVIETIFLKQDQDVRTKNTEKADDKNKEQNEQNPEEKMKRLKTPLSGKFASKILYNLARVGMYNKGIWYKLLKSITDNIDHVQTLDLSMSLSAVCDFANKDFIPQEDLKDFVQPHKNIITRRMFQIYNSLNGRTLQILKEFVRDKRIEKQIIPAWIRKEIQKEFALQKAKKQHIANQSRRTNYWTGSVNEKQNNSQFYPGQNRPQTQKPQRNIKSGTQNQRNKNRKVDQKRKSSSEHHQDMRNKQSSG